MSHTAHNARYLEHRFRAQARKTRERKIRRIEMRDEIMQNAVLGLQLEGFVYQPLPRSR